jgi:hypothetical protein
VRDAKKEIVVNNSHFFDFSRKTNGFQPDFILNMPITYTIVQTTRRK